MSKITRKTKLSPSRSELDQLKQFGQQLRKVRMERGLTLENCEELGFPSWRNLGDIENGQNCTILTFFRLMKVLKCRPEDIFKK